MRVPTSLTNLGLGQKLVDRRAQLPKPKRRCHCKYPESLVAHAKWLIKKGNTLTATARATGLSVNYVRDINDGIVRADIEPKEFVK